ncbi:MAG: hypothetical protein J0L92_25395 [Deltaproteobacteria bacterium]|nr:hypothetical protein [Deltaproteobacteria bacterium]
MTSDAFRGLFDRLAPFVLERQLIFEKENAGQPWQADVEAGTLVIAERTMRIEVLATYSSQSGTLLWSWARAARFGEGWPSSATRSASRVRELGRGVPELEEGMPVLSPEDADDVILVALGLLGGIGVAGGVPLSYRGDHDHGSVYLYVDAPELVSAVDMPALRVVSLFPQLIAMGVPLSSPREAFVAYCVAHAMKVTDAERTVRASDRTGSSVTARFDEHGRLEAIDSDLRKG